MRHFAWIAALALVLLGLSACGGGQAVATPDSSTPEVVAADRRTVAEAKVVPVRSASLSFISGGTVAEVLAKEGDSVASDQPLARLDSRRQRVGLDIAQARLEQAEASLRRIEAGARPEEIAAAEASLRQAQAQMRQTRASVTADDLRAAEAQIEQARVLLDRLRKGAKETDLRAAQAQLGQAQAALTTQRDQLSASKTNAQLQLDQATDNLKKAQTAYSTAQWNWRHIEEYGTDPISPTSPDPKTGEAKPNELNDAQKQQYRDALTQAEVSLRSAETAVQQAQVAYDTARQAEISGISSAEQQVSANQANLDRVRAGAEADQLASARAQLASARANLARMTGEQREAALDTAQAAIDTAQANLARITAGAPEADLILARAQVQTAKADLSQAQLELDQTELKAPFAGVIAAIDLRASEFVGPGVAVVRLADTSSWKIESTDLTEINVVGIKVGSRATITFEAIPGLELPGKVTSIRSFGENRQGDITYTVTVTPDQQDPRLRWNMTATLAIEPSE